MDLRHLADSINSTWKIISNSKLLIFLLDNILKLSTSLNSNPGLNSINKLKIKIKILFKFDPLIQGSLTFHNLL